MMNRIRRWMTLVMFLVSVAVFPQETLPPYHWANFYLDYLKVEGYLPGLSFIDRPFTRQQIARQLLTIDWRTTPLSATDRQLITTLYREFAPEMRQLGILDQQRWEPLLKKAIEFLKIEFPEIGTQPTIKTGVFSDMAYRYEEEGNRQTGDAEGHSQVGFFWKEGLSVYNNFKVFNRADANYIGKEYGGLFGYVEQGYVSFRKKWILAKFGRDYLQIGSGRSGQLLISDNSRPFDMYYVRIGSSGLQFTFWGAMLNRRTLKEAALREKSVVANRYLNGHRLSLNLGNRFFIGVSEVVLYGGPEQGWDFGFMNPFGIYYMNNVNLEPGAYHGNLLINIDWDLYLLPNLEIYGEFLIDDFQIDNETPNDLEPNELGFLGGIKWANPLGRQHTVLDLEYVHIRNRTYNVSSSDWEKYLHRNEGIGYFLGNNLERWQGGISYWVHPTLNLRLSGTLTRQGEGSVQGEFNQDYLNYTVEEGYDEPFPFGIVERHSQLGLSAFYKPHPYGHLQLELFWNDFSNYLHVENQNFSQITARVSLWLQWSKMWNWPR